MGSRFEIFISMLENRNGLVVLTHYKSSYYKPFVMVRYFVLYGCKSYKVPKMISVNELS